MSIVTVRWAKSASRNNKDLLSLGLCSGSTLPSYSSTILHLMPTNSMMQSIGLFGIAALLTYMESTLDQDKVDQINHILSIGSMTQGQCQPRPRPRPRAPPPEDYNLEDSDSFITADEDFLPTHDSESEIMYRVGKKRVVGNVREKLKSPKPVSMPHVAPRQQATFPETHCPENSPRDHRCGQYEK